MLIRKLKGWWDFRSGRHDKFYPWGFAMNGQTSRLEAVRQMMHALQVSRVVETGTFRGTTAEWFAQFGLPVETVEASERFFVFSKARLAKFKNVEITLGSSVPFLAERAKKTRGSEIQLFYLDAHWHGDLPLRQELQLIFSTYNRAVVVIDDFKVDDDGGYAYDDYGAGNALTKEFVVGSDVPKLHAFYPATPAKQETGMKTGWIVLTADDRLAEHLRTITLLRETPLN